MREWLTNSPAWGALIRYRMTEKPALRLALGAIMISFAPIMVRVSASPPTTAAFYRTFLGGLMLLLFLAIRRQPVALRRRVLLMLVAGGVAFAFDLFFWHRSIHLVGPGLATLLAGFQVFILAFVGVLAFGERVRWQLIVAIPAAFLGVALIIGIDWSLLTPAYRKGIAFGLITAICYSTYLLVMRWARNNASVGVSPIAEVAWMSLACAAVLAMLATQTGESLVINRGSEALLLLGYAFIAQLALVIISSSLHKVPASLVGLLLLLEPAFAYVWDLTFFHRSVTMLELAGAVLVIFAIFLGSMKPSKVPR